MDFTLATKVHADGHLLIVGINEQGREIFKLYMNDVDSPNESPSKQAKTQVVNEWANVEQKSHLNDFSDSDFS